MRKAINVAGAMVGVIGIVWILQGADVLENGSMSGDPKWSYVGVALIALAVVLMLIANRKRA